MATTHVDLSPDALGKLSEKELETRVIQSGGVPKHIAFIMDGNGRWAKARALPRIAGHRQGVKSVRRMVEVGPDIGVEVMTFYTFSAENWKRPRGEVSALMKLLVETINREIRDLKKNRVQVKIIGDLANMPEGPREAMYRAMEETKGNDRLTMVLALNYSGRREIVQAVNRIIAEGLDKVDENILASYLETSDLPDPDLLIRTSGEYRISNFLLYQIAYSEIVVTDKYWPEFSSRELYECILQYKRRERRFGKISEQVKS
ncbi:isoprenyl transferase [Calditrichota bacterium]